MQNNKSSFLYPWYVVFVLMLAYTVAFIDRQILSLLIEPIKLDLNISDTQIGLLAGLAFGIFYYLTDDKQKPHPTSKTLRKFQDSKTCHILQY